MVTKHCKICGDTLTECNRRPGCCSCRACYNKQQQEYYQRRKAAGFKKPSDNRKALDALRRLLDRKEQAIRQLQVDIEAIEDKIEEFEEELANNGQR